MATTRRLLSLLIVSSSFALTACGDDTNDAADADVRDDDSTSRPDASRHYDVDEEDASDGDALSTDADAGAPDSEADTMDLDGSTDTAPQDTSTEDTVADTTQPPDSTGDTDVTADVELDASPGLPNFILTEFMVASCEAEPGAGQWAELMNAGSRAASLDGLIISDGAGGVHRISGFPMIEPGGLVVVGASADRTENGGVDVDYVWSGLDFAATTGVFAIATDAATVFELRYDFLAVDDCASLALSGDSLTPAASADLDRYCSASTLYNASDSGTPGDNNPVCTVPDLEVDWCRLQFPVDLSVLPGVEETAYVRLFNDGTTTLTAGTDEDDALRIEFGIGPDGVLPSDERWAWTEATANTGWNDAAEPGNDEYQATLTAPEVPGAYDFAFRASRDDGRTWLYCDRAAGPGADGAENGYQPANAGALTVTDLCAEAECPVAERVSCDGNTRTRAQSDGSCTVVDGAAVCAETVETIDECDEATPCTAAGDAAFCLGDEVVEGTCSELAECPESLEPTCEGSLAVTSTRQRCDLGACVFDVESVDCAETDQTCEAGACVTASRPVGYCVVQFPKDFEVLLDGAATVYGRVYIEGLTDLSRANDTDALVITRVGTGVVGTAPDTDPSWVWADGAPNDGYTATDEPNNDEYFAEIVASTTGAGVGEQRDVAFSVSTDGGESWFYCDRNGGGFRAYDPAQAARMTVTLDI